MDRNEARRLASHNTPGMAEGRSDGLKRTRYQELQHQQSHNTPPTPLPPFNPPMNLGQMEKHQHSQQPLTPAMSEYIDKLLSMSPEEQEEAAHAASHLLFMTPDEQRQAVKAATQYLKAKGIKGGRRHSSRTKSKKRSAASRKTGKPGKHTTRRRKTNSRRRR